MVHSAVSPASAREFMGLCDVSGGCCTSTFFSGLFLNGTMSPLIRKAIYLNAASLFIRFPAYFLSKVIILCGFIITIPQQSLRRLTGNQDLRWVDKCSTCKSPSFMQLFFVIKDDTTETQNYPQNERMPQGWTWCFIVAQEDEVTPPRSLVSQGQAVPCRHLLQQLDMQSMIEGLYLRNRWVGNGFPISNRMLKLMYSH